MTLSITILYIECHCAECCYAECRDLFIVILNVVVLNVIMLSVIMLSVIMMNVVAPRGGIFYVNLSFFPLSFLADGPEPST